MLTAALAPGAADFPIANPVSPAGWGRGRASLTKETQLLGASVFFIMTVLGNPLGKKCSEPTWQGGGEVWGGSGLPGTCLFSVACTATVCFHR